MDLSIAASVTGIVPRPLVKRGNELSDARALSLSDSGVVRQSEPSLQIHLEDQWRDSTGSSLLHFRFLRHNSTQLMLCVAQQSSMQAPSSEYHIATVD